MCKFVAKKYGLPSVSRRQGEIPFENPRCNANRKFHNWAQGAKTIVVNSRAEAGEAIRSVYKSKLLAVHVTATAKKYFTREMTTLAVRTDDAAIFLCLGVMQERHVSNFLSKMKNGAFDRAILGKDVSNFYSLANQYNLKFQNVVDLDVVAKRLGWKGVTWGNICEKLTSGPFCHRASIPASRVRLSEVALEHEKSRLALLYEFYDRNRKLISLPSQNFSRGHRSYC